MPRTYNSSETFRNVPLLLSHVCLCAVRFDGYEVEIGSKKVEIAISSCARYNSNMSEISMHEKMFVYGGTRKWES